MQKRSRYMLVLSLCAVPALAVAATGSVTAGWTPIVSLYGGDPASAVRTLDRINGAYEAFLGHTEVDGPTQDFLDEATDHLKDFDLGGLVKLLPDVQGEGRALYVRGELKGNRYLVTRADPGSKFKVSLRGPRNKLADMSATLYAAEREVDDEDRYLLGATFGLGLGPLSWGGIMRAERDLARLATLGTPDPARMQPVQPSASARATVKQKNPGLGNEDELVLGVLYDAFPTLGELLTHVGVVEDVVRGAAKNGAYPIRLRLRAQPDRLKENYKHFANYVDDLDDVMVADLRLTDDKGRTITEIHIDSDKLLFEVKAYIKDGLPVPYLGSTVYVDEPLDPLSGELSKPTVMIDADLHLLGLDIKLDDLKLTATYATTDGHTIIDGRISSVPKIEIDGRAFGLFSPRFVDFFIPGDIEGQTRHFFGVLARGNSGKGGNAHIEIGGANTNDPGVLVIDAETESVDSFIVRIGAGVIADRVIPSTRAAEDADRLWADMHSAFKADFKSYSNNLGG